MGGTADRQRTITIRWRARGQPETLGPSLESLYPIDETSGFDQALEAIDQAERQVWNDGGPEGETRD